MSKLTTAEKLRLGKIFANAHSENVVLRGILARLVFAARTTGGTAGRDDGLCAICDEAEALLTTATDDDAQRRRTKQTWTYKA